MLCINYLQHFRNGLSRQFFFIIIIFSPLSHISEFIFHISYYCKTLSFLHKLRYIIVSVGGVCALVEIIQKLRLLLDMNHIYMYAYSMLIYVCIYINIGVRLVLVWILIVVTFVIIVVILGVSFCFQFMHYLLASFSCKYMRWLSGFV